MTMTIRNAISASSAFCDTCEPQLEPTVVTGTLLTFRRNCLAIEDWILSACAVDSWLVWTCQKAALPIGLTSLAVGLVPPLAVTTWLRLVADTLELAGTVNSEP